MASPFDGTWVSDVNTPLGPKTVTFEFRSLGDRLEGTATVGSHVVDVSDGHWLGDTAEFKLKVKRGIATVTGKVKAQVAGDTIMGTGKAMGQKLDFTAKRK